MGSIGRFLVGLLALFALYLFGARTRAPVIENDIQTRTSRAMMEAGWDAVTVSTDGRDVTLTGVVPSADAVEAAGRVAWDTWGVRVVDNLLEAASTGAYRTTFCKEGDVLVLQGALPDEAERRRLAAEAEMLFPQGSLDDRLEVRAGSPEDYSTALEILLAEVVQLEEGCVRVSDTSAALAGVVRSQEAADRIRMQGRAAELLGWQVTYDLDVPTLSEPAAECRDEWARLLAAGEPVLFDFDSSELHAEGRAVLDEVAEISTRCPDVDILVTGHTDSVGDREYNIRLSRERAQAVVDYLVSVGMDAGRLTPVGYGFAQPVADNATEEGRARNRRIELRVQEN